MAKALAIKGFDAVSDCTHVLMNAVKKLLGCEEVLRQLHANVGQLRRRLILSELGYLLPTSMRDKDRFIRIFTLGKWIDRIDRWWPKTTRGSMRPFDIHRASTAASAVYQRGVSNNELAKTNTPYSATWNRS